MNLGNGSLEDFMETSKQGWVCSRVIGGVLKALSQPALHKPGVCHMPVIRT